MKIPNYVRIKARVKYEILWADVIKEDPDCMGICDPQKRQIIIKNGLSESEELKTFIHEVSHAVCIEYDIDIPHRSIYLLEDAVIKLCRLNKWF
jgi:hypothetical protein